MQAWAHPCDTKRLKHQLVEGKVYALSNFEVGKKLKFYMACSNGLVISMGEQTEVVEINDRAGSSIPLHSFEFVDFGDVPSRDKDTSLLTGGFSWELIVSLQ
jgi:replication factor A1